MIIMLVLLLGGLLLMNMFAKKSQAKRTAAREEMMSTSMKPGVWVQTFSGFFGRLVDVDGDVIILETPSGEETYWLKAAIKGVIDPPFEVPEDELDEADAITDSDLDELEAKFQDHIESSQEVEVEEIAEVDSEDSETVEAQITEVIEEPGDPKADN